MDCQQQLGQQLGQIDVKTALKTEWLGHDYHYYPVLGSTNDELKRLAAEAQLAAGAVVLADFQSQGRGRMQRSWLAPPGSSLLHSILLRPDWPAEQAGWLMMMVGLAAVTAVEQVAGVVAGLKWPNDVMVQQAGAWYKVGGILLTGEMANGRLQQAIVGIGINVNITTEQMPQTAAPASSLLIASQQPISRLALLMAFWQQLEQLYETAESPHQAWQQRLITLGQAVQVSQPGQAAITGLAEAADKWGSLLVRDESGQLHSFAAADVTLRHGG